MAGEHRIKVIVPIPMDTAGVANFAAHLRYFANGDRKHMAPVFDCFHEEELFCVQTAHMRLSGKNEIHRKFEDLFAAWPAPTSAKSTFSTPTSGAFAKESFRKSTFISATRTSSSER